MTLDMGRAVKIVMQPSVFVTALAKNCQGKQ
jgi:hypothetical protein